MHPMHSFAPDLPCRLHDRLRDKFVIWYPDWADRWHRYAVIYKCEDAVSFDGRIFDGWESL